jgi:Flp pilus assembly protein TadD
MRSLITAGLVAAGLALALAAGAVDTESTAGAPDLTAVRAEIRARNFPAAVSQLQGLVARGVEHADVYSLLGYSLRKSGDLPAAMTYYQKALDFDPDHKGALEYQGELFVQLGDIVQARRNLARLTTLCPRGCEERADLEQALATAARRN